MKNIYKITFLITAICLAGLITKFYDAISKILKLRVVDELHCGIVDIILRIILICICLIVLTWFILLFVKAV